MTSPTDLRLHPNHEPSLWLRNEMQAIGRHWLKGQGGNCGHLTLPMFTALWQRDFICVDCFDQHSVVEEPENHRCDRCRQVVDTIHRGYLGGALVIALGLCEACMTREAGAL